MCARIGRNERELDPRACARTHSRRPRHPCGILRDGMSRQNVEVVRAVFEAFERDDLSGVLSLCDPEIEITQAADVLGAPQHLRGHAGVLEALADWTEQWDDYRIEVVGMTDMGEHVMVSQVARGRGKGTGIPVEMLFTFLFLVRAGKITEWRIFTREDEALKAVGMEE
jgi:ketosteroid isomerase-like protein